MNRTLIVSPAPNITKNYSTNTFMWITLVALLPTAISGVFNFGFNALYLILLSVACCYCFDVLFNYLKTKKWVFLDLSSVVTGLMLALFCCHRGFCCNCCG